MSGVRCQVSGVTCQVSRVTCQVSCVTCQVSGVMCHVSFFFSLFFLWTKWLGYSVEGLLSTGPTPSSLYVCLLKDNCHVWFSTWSNFLAANEKGRAWKRSIKNKKHFYNVQPVILVYGGHRKINFGSQGFLYYICGIIAVISSWLLLQRAVAMTVTSLAFHLSRITHALKKCWSFVIFQTMTWLLSGSLKEGSWD